jgi:hypothetical protein
MHEIISSRYERTSIIITNSRMFEEWARVFGNDLLACVALDHLPHHTRTLTICSSSYRQRQRRKKAQGASPDLPTAHRKRVVIHTPHSLSGSHKQTQIGHCCKHDQITWQNMVEPPFQTPSRWFSKHDWLDHFGTLQPTTSGPLETVIASSIHTTHTNCPIMSHVLMRPPAKATPLCLDCTGQATPPLAGHRPGLLMGQFIRGFW